MAGVSEGRGESGGGKEEEIKWREGTVREESNFKKVKLREEETER